MLSGKRAVSDEMRERVLAAIEELDYRPHGPARALASGTSRTIALFLPSPHWQLVPVQQTFVAGATQATSASDYALLLSTAATDPEAVARVVATGRADGVILMETLADDPRVERLQADGHPFALIGRTRDTTGISYVDVDFGDAVGTSLAHLARLGHPQGRAVQLPARAARGGLHLGADRARRLRGDAPPSSASAASTSRAPTQPREAFAVAARAAALGAGVHGRDHDRLAVHRTARRAARGRSPRALTTSRSSR